MASPLLPLTVAGALMVPLGDHRLLGQGAEQQALSGSLSPRSPRRSHVRQ